MYSSGIRYNSSAATGIPFVNNVDFALATPVVANQIVGTVTATQPVGTWTLVADSSSAFPGNSSPGPTGSSSPPSIQINPNNTNFFSIDNAGVIRVTSAGVPSGVAGWQGQAVVLTVKATNSFGSSPDNTGYVTINIPLQTVGPRTGLTFPGPCSVGYYNEPGFFTLSNPNGRGLFTVNSSASPSFTSGTAGNPTIVRYVDFDSGGDGVSLSSLHDINFIGCRFQSSEPQPPNVGTGGRSALSLTGCTRLTFSYCSFVPYVSLSAHPIPMKSWPSSGAFIPIAPAFEDTDPNMGTKLSNYMVFAPNTAQFKINDSSGGCTFEFCDVWGNGNAYIYNGPINSDQAVFQHSWIHDARSDVFYSDHSDGIGYLGNTLIPIQNLTVQYNTMGGFGGQDLIAWQTGTGNMTNMNMIGNFMAGYSSTTKWPETAGITFSNCNVTDNIYSSEFNIVGSMILNGTAIASPGCVWRRNKWRWAPVSQAGQSGQQFAGQSYDWGGHGGTEGGSAIDGQFILPNVVPPSGEGGGKPSVTDYTG